jgi:hypothetical protein
LAAGNRQTFGFRSGGLGGQSATHQRTATTDLYRTGAYPITARPSGLERNPFYERGGFDVDLRVTKGFEWWPDHGIFLFGVGFYNLTNHTNPLRVSPYFGLATYRGLIETMNARQAQFSFQWEF